MAFMLAVWVQAIIPLSCHSPETDRRSVRRFMRHAFRLVCRLAFASVAMLSSSAMCADAPQAGHPDSAPVLDMRTCSAFAETVGRVRSPEDDGNVELKFTVSPAGEVVSAKVVSRTASPYLASMARLNFSQCHFTPAYANGVAVEGVKTMVFVFNMSGEGTGPNGSNCPVPFVRNYHPHSTELVTDLRLTFAPTGTVTKTEIVKSSGFADLDDAAVAAYSQCRFDPAAEGRPPFKEQVAHSVRWAF